MAPPPGARLRGPHPRPAALRRPLGLGARARRRPPRARPSDPRRRRLPRVVVRPARRRRRPRPMRRVVAPRLARRPSSPPRWTTRTSSRGTSRCCGCTRSRIRSRASSRAPPSPAGSRPRAWTPRASRRFSPGPRGSSPPDRHQRRPRRVRAQTRRSGLGGGGDARGGHRRRARVGGVVPSAALGLWWLERRPPPGGFEDAAHSSFPPGVTLGVALGVVVSWRAYVKVVGLLGWWRGGRERSEKEEEDWGFLVQGARGGGGRRGDHERRRDGPRDGGRGGRADVTFGRETLRASRTSFRPHYVRDLERRVRSRLVAQLASSSLPRALLPPLVSWRRRSRAPATALRPRRSCRFPRPPLARSRTRTWRVS